MKRKNKTMDLRKKDCARKFSRKSHETEEAAIIRRFHDAQRMARFRAKRKKALEEERALKTVNHLDTSFISELMKRNITLEIVNSISPFSTVEKSQKHFFVQNSAFIVGHSGKNKYSQLLTVIEELGKDIRLTYAGSRSSIERLKTGIVRARTLIKDCLLETEVNSYN